MLDDNIAFALMAQILSPAFRSACHAALLAKSLARGCACFSCCKGLERIEHESKASSAFGHKCKQTLLWLSVGIFMGM